MSVIRPKPPEDPLHYDPAGLEAAAGLPVGGVARWAACLEPLRDAVLAAPGPGLPERLLADYTTAGDATGTTGRAASELFAILRTARRVREAVDRVIVAGGGATAARAIVDACCHPCHNELSRGERGGRPRLSFAPPLIDNDSLQALLDLAAPAGAHRTADLLDRWAIVAVDGGAPAAPGTCGADHADHAGETGDDGAACVRLLVAALAAATGDAAAAATPPDDRFAAVAAATGPLADLCVALGRPPDFTAPAGVGGFAVLGAAGLLPAAIAGCDVVRLLAGARAMHRRFVEAPAAANPVLQFAAAARLAEDRLAATAGGLVAWSPQLAAACGWYDAVRPRRGRATFRTAVLAGEPRRDPVRVPEGGAAWPERHARGVAAARAAAAPDAATPAAILLPRIDEHAFGQLVMMLLLSTALTAAAESASGDGRRPR